MNIKPIDMKSFKTAAVAVFSISAISFTLFVLLELDFINYKDTPLEYLGATDGARGGFGYLFLFSFFAFISSIILNKIHKHKTKPLDYNTPEKATERAKNTQSKIGYVSLGLILIFLSFVLYLGNGGSLFGPSSQNTMQAIITNVPFIGGLVAFIYGLAK